MSMNGLEKSNLIVANFKRGMDIPLQAEPCIALPSEPQIIESGAIDCSARTTAGTSSLKSFLRSLKTFAEDLGFSGNTDLECKAIKAKKELELRKEIADAKSGLNMHIDELRHRSERYVTVGHAAFQALEEANQFLRKHPNIKHFLKIPDLT